MLLAGEQRGEEEGKNLRIIAHQVLLQLLLATSTGRAASEHCWRTRCAAWWADGGSTRGNGQ